VLSNQLIFPMRERMSRSGSKDESIFPGQLVDCATQVCNVSPSFLYVFADAGSDLDHRLMHFGLDLLAQKHLTFFKNFIYARFQLARFGIDDLELFFNPDGKKRLAHSISPCVANGLSLLLT